MTHGAGIVVGRIGFASVTGDKGRQVAAVRRLAPEEAFPVDHVAPELRQGAPASVQSDLYALGVYLRGLFEAERTAYPALAPAPVFHPLPRPYAAFFARATAPLPAARFRSAREMLLELHAARCEAGSPIEAAWAAQAMRGNALDWAAAFPDNAGGVPGAMSARHMRTLPIPAEALSSAYPAADRPRRSALLRVAAGAVLAAGLTGFLVWQSEAVRLERMVTPWPAEADDSSAPGSAADVPEAAHEPIREPGLPQPSAAAAAEAQGDVPEAPPEALPIADREPEADERAPSDEAVERAPAQGPGFGAATELDEAPAASPAGAGRRTSTDAPTRAKSRPSRRHELRTAGMHEVPAPDRGEQDVAPSEPSAAITEEEASSQPAAGAPEGLPSNPY